MCFPFDAIVPDLPPGLRVIAGGAAGEPLTLTSADGTAFSAYLAPADGPTGVVVLPDVRGLFRFYEQLAERFAAAGHPAIAIDYFGRTAGLGPRDETFEYRPHVQQTTPGGVQTDVAACVQHLRANGVTSLFTVGFCFGGRNSWLASAAGHDLAGSIGFYGRPGPGNDGTPGPIQRAGDMKAPILALQGGDDPGIPVEDSQELDRALSEAGVEHEVVIYEGAPHSFFDRKYEEFAADSVDAWNRVLAFLARYA